MACMNLYKNTAAAEAVSESSSILRDAMLMAVVDWLADAQVNG